MQTPVEIVLVAVAVLVAVYLILSQRRSIRQLRAEREEIEGEERRMFDFLHGLGETLQTDNSSKNMNRYIVRGVVNVVAARGGCLYLLDKDAQELVPAFRTPDCAPFIAVPVSVLDEGGGNEKSLDSFLRLCALSRDSGILGRCLARREPATTTDLSAHSTPKSGETVKLQRRIPAMVAPLVYGGKEIGVLAVAGRKNGEAFSSNDFDVFKSIAEQSSFALGSAIIHQEAHEKQQLDKEIQIASDIQKILLPFASPTLEGYFVTGVNYPAKTVSGDYYDYIAVDEAHCGIVIGDVSGKGIPASLIMAMCRSVVRVQAANNLSPCGVLSSVNRAVFSDIREDMFVTMAYLILDKHSNRVTLVRAGHDPPLLYRKADRSVVLVKPPGLAVGIDSGDVFDRVTHNHSFEMESGDTLFLYTDGATEAVDRNGMEFGIEPIEKAIKETAEEGTQAILDRVSRDLRQFFGGMPQNDDITLIAIQKR